MSKFAGFPSGKVHVTPLPDLFFSELLAQIDDLAELKVTLHVLWRLAHHQAPLCISLTELRADSILQQSLVNLSLDDALQRAVQRQALIELRTKNKTGDIERWYFANSESGRRDVARVRQGQVRLKRATVIVEPVGSAPRPNVFTLYEQYIGMLTPLIAEQLQEAAQSYAPQWVAEAFQIAAQHDKRNWRYVQAILQRWAREGRLTDDPAGRSLRWGRRRKLPSQPALKPKPKQERR